jgi:hypothetical protein
MRKSPLAAIEDILETIDRICCRLAGVTFEEFHSD